MLTKLKEKTPEATVVQADILKFETDERYDYIFTSSGSVSLFTDLNLCKKILSKLKELLKPEGVFVFAVDTIANQCKNDDDFKTLVQVKTKDQYDLVLKTKDYFDESTQTQFMPSIYELYDGDQLLQKEMMDFQTHLYAFGEMEAILNDIGFKSVKTYNSFEKDLATSNHDEMFLYECKLN